jgi:hypothetical protein
MSRLIRMDRTGHTELAHWSAGAQGDADFMAARETFAGELAQGYFAVVTCPDGTAEQVRELPLDADLVVLRRPIAGG